MAAWREVLSPKQKILILDISPANWRILSELYETTDDIDLFVGGLAEVPVPGGLTGPTFNCIMAKQLVRAESVRFN